MNVAHVRCFGHGTYGLFAPTSQTWIYSFWKRLMGSIWWGKEVAGFMMFNGDDCTPPWKSRLVSSIRRPEKLPWGNLNWLENPPLMPAMKLGNPELPQNPGVNSGQLPGSDLGGFWISPCPSNWRRWISGTATTKISAVSSCPAAWSPWRCPSRDSFTCSWGSWNFQVAWHGYPTFIMFSMLRHVSLWIMDCIMLHG